MSSLLINALRDPERYPHPVESVELIETHISWVLLAGEFAYKIKKPVDFGFLDFSDLSQRRHYCEEEIRLNQRTAPDLYLDVVALSGSLEEPVFERGTTVFEYAVRMRRFDPAQGFDQLLARGDLLDDHIEALGEALAELHDVAEVAPADAKWGSPDEVIAPMRDNFTDLKRLLAGGDWQARLDALARWTEDRFADLGRLVADRRQQGFVRECHGDVHLGNVTLVDGKTTLFDCIEFSPDLRWTDVMADLGFIVMDLREHGADRYAWRLLDRYLARTGDYEGLALLDFYVVYRAMVRAKVAALGLADDAEHNRRILANIDRYLALGERIVDENRPAIVLACGVSGSGKSYLAKALVADCGLVRLRSDVERKRLFGLREFDGSQSALGKGIYGQQATTQTYQRLLTLADAVTDAGLPVFVDATFLTEQKRECFRALARSKGIVFGVMVCTADESVLRERVARRAASQDDPSEADTDVLQKQLEQFDEPCNDDVDTRVIDTGSPGSVERARRWLLELLN
jgi:aminoglycoside phosphotransferase family enzyme/predicted kinase